MLFTRFSASAGTFWSWNTSQLENKPVSKYILVEHSQLEHQSVGKNVGLDSDRKSAFFICKSFFGGSFKIS